MLSHELTISNYVINQDLLIYVILWYIIVYFYIYNQYYTEDLNIYNW